MNALQIIGTLLAIPVGLGSAYTMYRANFTVEATCQSLRGNIVAMLDKTVDPATRHMLVRHDVEAFENNCRGVDPDATAAFKALLAADKSAVAAAPVKPAEERAETVTRKADPRPVVAAKPAPAVAADKTDAAATPRDNSSDAVWLAAVRQALVSRPVDAKQDAKPDAGPAKAAAVTPRPAAEAVKPAPAVAPVAAAQEARRSEESRQQPLTLAPPVQISAPVLPPPATVAAAPAAPVDDGHPVPPGSIPEPPLVTNEAAAKPVAHPKTRLGGLVAQIPLLGWAFDR
jgi:hypothetical protein